MADANEGAFPLQPFHVGVAPQLDVRIDANMPALDGASDSSDEAEETLAFLMMLLEGEQELARAQRPQSACRT